MAEALWNEGYYKRFGFESKPRIRSLPETCPRYNWMVRWPHAPTMTAKYMCVLTER